MPENVVIPETPIRTSTPPIKVGSFITATLALNGGTTFLQRREDIFKRLQHSAEQCRLNYSGRKELATEKDDCVAELCEALEDAFSYGLRQQNSSVAVTAASLFQNMQEIVTGNISVHDASNDVTFWDFCQLHLTPHERQRYEQLKQVWTKCGRGKAFIRATLNENSLQRYLLTWLSDTDELRRFYTPWSLLLDTTASEALPPIVGSLSKVLFALTVDTTELNAPTRIAPPLSNKEEPIIYAPSPAPVTSVKSKRKANAVERPIATASSTEDLLNALKEVSIVEPPQPLTFEGFEEYAQEIDTTPPDPIEPELEFLKHPLPDYLPENPTVLPVVHSVTANGATSTTALGSDHDFEDKSDSSSQYSAPYNEEKFRELEERCAQLETRVAQLSRENRQLVRRLTQNFNGLGIDPSASLATNFLITIPHMQLLKSKHGSSYYAYEVHITMRQNLEHWVVLRRYRDFHKLHKSLLRTHPSIAAVEFPPKKHFGNMNLAFVEERRQQLQIYLLNVVEALPPVEACKSKAELQKVFAFLRER